MFKPKPPKTLASLQKKNSTLDTYHAKKLETFSYDNQYTIPQLKEEKQKIKSTLKKENLDVEKRLELEDRLKTIRATVNKHRVDEKNYMLDNCNYIFDYFEGKKKIAEGTSKTTVLDKFFNIGKPQVATANQERSNVRRYLNNIDETTLNLGDFSRDLSICKACKKGEMVPVDHEGILVCNQCSVSIKYLVEHEKPSYKEPPKEVCFYAYKRINHFREILAQFQAKETTQIPEEVLQAIRLQIKKERIGLAQLTNKKAKEILKKLRYNKYYEHIPFIKDKLGIRPPIMSPELEDTLCNLFMEIQAPYAKFCPDDRVNFLNYYYTVYKLCELLDQKQFLPYFPMLKDREKRIEQDEIWHNICNDLGWEFIPTV
tara:strand:+ start:67 stop:1182 length:1116 start_codon:yes stop_codon:yes gene_type:complete